MKVKVSLTRVMDVNEETLKFLKEAATDNDMQAFLEMTDLDSGEGKIEVVEQ